MPKPGRFAAPLAICKRAALAAILLLSPATSAAVAELSLRFYGNGISAPDLDRVKIPIDRLSPDTTPGPPVDVGATDFTIEFWVKARQTDNAAAAVVCGANLVWIKGDIVIDRGRINQPRSYGVSLAGGVVVWGLRAEGYDVRTICGTTFVLDNSWHHVALQRRRSDGHMWLFVDGRLDVSADGPDGDLSYPDDAVPCGNCCREGSNCNDDDPYIVLGAEKYDLIRSAYNGYLDEMRFSSALRYPLAGNFTRPVQPFVADGSTVALYHFNEGGGSILVDSSNAPGGPSNGMVMFGGSPPGPVWSVEAPFSGGTTTTTTTTVTTSTTTTLPDPCAAASAVPGDCNATATIDAGDAICTVLCLIGQPGPGADCACGSDCNCSGGVEAADPICAVLRLIGGFTPDSCVVGAPVGFSAGLVSEVESAKVSVRAKRVRRVSRMGRRRVVLSLVGKDADRVAGLRLFLRSERGRVGRIRLARRLRRRGFAIERGGARAMPTLSLIPPFQVPIEAIGVGRIARVTLPAETRGLISVAAEFGSTAGQPLAAAIPTN